MLRNILTALVFLLTTTVFAFQIDNNWQDKISPKLNEQITAGATQLDFIVLLHSQANVSSADEFSTKIEKGQFVLNQLQETANTTQAPLINIINAQNAFYQSFYVINAIRVKGSPALLMELAAQNSTRKIISNSPYKLEEPIIDENIATLREATWGIEMINADDVWAMGYSGQDVVIGGQDTGYDWTHPALKTKYRGYIDENTADHNYNWHDAIFELDTLNNDDPFVPNTNPCGLQVPYPCDDNQHGTHTMGTMIGSDGENEIGVAPNAKWIGCRNMERGWGSPASYIDCFQWLMAPTDLNDENPNPAMAPVAFANSWGCPPVEGCDSSNYEIMEMVVDNIKNSGIVVVVSAGNSGSECSSVENPAAIFENSFTVGSTRFNDTISSFSSRGPVIVDGSFRMKPDISAPGSGVYSSVLDNEYASLSGTSMAGPHVVGVIALMISANPELAGQVDVIENIIKATAVQLDTEQECGDIPGSQYPNNTYGHGRIDALAAVEMALELTNTEDIDLASPIRVYPNPFSDELSFDLPNLQGNTTAQIFNATGQLIFQQNWTLNGTTTKTMSIPNLASGIYFYKIENEAHRYEGKVIKK